MEAVKDGAPRREETFTVRVLNNISPVGLRKLPVEKYVIESETSTPDAILLRSFNMHDMEIPETLKAVGRAGAGVNNIPVDVLSKRGVPVFNAPGANANAVKELVLAAMFLSARNICEAWDYVRDLSADKPEELNKLVEQGKKKFVGFELPGKTLGVVGLGAIGVEVANSALALGMNVLGFDPAMTVQRAWQLSAGVQQAGSIEDLIARSDFVTVHVPLVDATRALIGETQIRKMPRRAILMNFARGPIVEEAAVLNALDDDRIAGYVCDFPTLANKNHAKVIALPHLGASTGEAEENCAAMVAANIREFLEDGNIRHSVNFPEAIMPRVGGYRLAVANANVPNMVGQISTCLAEAGQNIVDLLNKSRGDLAYTLVDVEQPLSPDTFNRIRAIDGVLSARLVG